MKNTSATVLAAALVVSASFPALAQSKQRPSGEHYDTKQQKCVKHGD